LSPEEAASTAGMSTLAPEGWRVRSGSGIITDVARPATVGRSDPAVSSVGLNGRENPCESVV